jgi:hypothetical protein
VEKSHPGFKLDDDKRVLFHEGFIMKKGSEALIKRSNLRGCLLFNDVFVVSDLKLKNNEKKDSGADFKNASEITVSHVVPIQSMVLVDLDYDKSADPYSFEIR